MFPPLLHFIIIIVGTVRVTSQLKHSATSLPRVAFLSAPSPSGSGLPEEGTESLAHVISGVCRLSSGTCIALVVMLPGDHWRFKCVCLEDETQLLMCSYILGHIAGIFQYLLWHRDPKSQSHWTKHMWLGLEIEPDHLSIYKVDALCHETTTISHGFAFILWKFLIASVFQSPNCYLQVQSWTTSTLQSSNRKYYPISVCYSVQFLISYHNLLPQSLASYHHFLGDVCLDVLKHLPKICSIHWELSGEERY